MPATQPANTGIGNGGTGANTGAGGYTVTVSPNGQMTITQGGRQVYSGPRQGTSLVFNQSGQLTGYQTPTSSATIPISTATSSSTTPASSSATPQASGSGSSQQFSVAEAEKAGFTVLPGTDANGGPLLEKNGIIYNEYGTPLRAANASQQLVMVNGVPTLVGGNIQQSISKNLPNYVSPTQPGLTLAETTPAVDYHTFGESAQINWANPNSPDFTITVPLPNGNTFTYSGSVAGVILGSQMATDQAVDQAWQAYTQGLLSNPSAFATGNVSVGNSTQGLTMAVTPTTNIQVAQGSKYQTITTAPGLTYNLPTSMVTSNGTTVTGSWVNNSGQFTFQPSVAYTPASNIFTNGLPQGLPANTIIPIATNALGYATGFAGNNGTVTSNYSVDGYILTFNSDGTITAIPQNEMASLPPGSYIQGNTLYTTGNYSPAWASGTNVMPAATTSGPWLSPAPTTSQPANQSLSNIYGTPSIQQLARLALQQQLMNEAASTGNYYPYSLLAHAMGIPAMFQNIGAGFNQVLGNAYTYLTGQPATQYISFNPLANLPLQSLAQEIPTLSILANNLPSTISLPGGINIPNLGTDFLKGNIYLIEGLGNAMYGAAAPNTQPIQRAIDLATLGVAGLGGATGNVGRYALYGLGSEGLTAGLNYLIGNAPGTGVAQAGQLGFTMGPLFDLVGAASSMSTKGISGALSSALSRVGITLPEISDTSAPFLSRLLTGTAERLPGYMGSFAALNTLYSIGSSELNGKTPTVNQLESSAEWGALFGALASLGATAFTIPIQDSIPDIKTVSISPQESTPINVETNIPGMEKVGGEVTPSQSYSLITEKYYPNLFSKLIGRSTTVQYLVPLDQDLISLANGKGLAANPEIDMPLYIKDADGVFKQVDTLHLKSQATLTNFIDAIKGEYTLNDGVKVNLNQNTLPVLLNEITDAESKGMGGIPFEGKLYSLDDYLDAVQSQKVSNLPAVLNSKGEPLTPEELRTLVLDFSNKPPDEILGKMFNGLINNNPAIYSTGTVFKPLAEGGQGKAKFTFDILQVFLQKAAEDAGFDEQTAETLSTSTALKLANNLMSLSNQIAEELPAPTQYAMLTYGFDPIELRLYNSLLEEGFFSGSNQAGNIETKTTPGGAATTEGGEGYIYIENPDGTVSAQKVISETKESGGLEKQQTIEQNEELETTKQEEQEAESTENAEAEQQGKQITEPEAVVEESQAVVAPTAQEQNVVEEGGQKGITSGKLSTKQKEMTGQQIKEITPTITIEQQKGMLGQPIKEITAQKPLAGQKEIVAEQEEQQTPTTTPPVTPPTNPPKKQIELPWALPWWYEITQGKSIVKPLSFESVYSPSLIPLLLPETEALAEQTYSPLTATAGLRPLRNPEPQGKALTLGTEPLPQGSYIQGNTLYTTTNYSPASASGMNVLPATQYSPLISTVPDPEAIARAISLAQQFNSQNNLVLPKGVSQAPANPFEQAEAQRLENALKGVQGRALGKGNAGAILSSPAVFGGVSNMGGLTSVNGISLVPTAYDLLQVLGPDRLFAYLNQINPFKYNSQTLLNLQPAQLLREMQSLPYDVLLQIYNMLPMYTKAQVLMLEGIPPGEALSIAQLGALGLGVPPQLGFVGQNEKKLRQNIARGEVKV